MKQRSIRFLSRATPRTRAGDNGLDDLAGASASPNHRKVRGWARADLAREIYWASDPVAPRPEVRSTAKLTDITRELERTLRADARAALPPWEPTLKAGTRWRRVSKRVLFRLFRPMTRRYDRVAADLAMVEGSIAQQLERSEAEVRRLAASLERLEARLLSAELPDENSTIDVTVAPDQTSTADGAEHSGVAAPTQEQADSAKGQEAAGSPADDRRLPEETEPADRFYWLFEEKMRGSPDSITSRLRTYEDRVTELRAGVDDRDPPLWIDLGCGQGEFGLLLSEWGMSFRGVDSSGRAVEACRARGLDVEHGNLVEYLQSYSGDPPLGISAIQVIEHLPKDLWLTLFLEAKRILRPGGVLLVETVNILAPGPLAQSFFPDPTHTWPPHPETIRLMAVFAGFAKAEITFLNHDAGGNAQDFALRAVTPS